MRQKGFTLIELMIVVAIIAIILAIIVAQFRDSGNSSVSIYSETANMGVTGGTVPDVKSQTLVCSDANNNEERIAAIPGQVWSFEGGVYVSGDANGNPITVSAADKNCKVEVENG